MALQTVVACHYGDPDGAFQWFMESFTKSLEELKDVGKKGTLDAKLAPALRKAVLH